MSKSKSKKKKKFAKHILGEEAGVAKVIVSSISHDFTEPLGQIYTAKNLLNKRNWTQGDPTELFMRFEDAAEVAQRIESLVEEFVNTDGIEDEDPREIISDFSQLIRPHINQLSGGNSLGFDLDHAIESDEPAIQRNEAETIKSAALQMINLLRGMKSFADDLGQPSKRGGRAYQKANPVDFLQRIVDLLKFGRENVEIRVIDNWSSSWPKSVKINHGQMRTALQNVISNSIKYSGGTGRSAVVEVGALIATTKEFSGPLGTRLKKLKWKGDWLVFYVRDNGVGIDQKELSKVQRLSWRGSNVKGIKGRGLGLAIVNAYSVSHGGTFFLESQLNEGTFAQIVIPAATDHEGELEQ